MAAALETIVKQLTDSGIIAPGKLENFVPPKANPQSVDELVAELVKHKELTPFQAAQVKAGKVRALILGEYTLLDRIGAGGMGQVFKAVHRRMERVVAIKMLPPAMTKDAAALARFQREVVAAAKLHHQNIVTAHDAGQAGPGHFLVMEYVDGRDLSAIVKQNGALPVNKAVNYILQAARGLEFAHSEGVVHRDIKPANLLLDKKGVVKILDMGLARIEQADGAHSDLTGSGTIMGTVDYMAPEQGMSTKHADARADIYSLGCSLYYLLAGKAMYGGETMAAKLVAHHTQAIPPLRNECPQVSEQLDAIYQKMVAKKLEDRYQSMTKVIEALEGLGIGSTATRGGEAATVALSAAQKKKLAGEANPAGLGASKKIRQVAIASGALGIIVIASLVVFSLMRSAKSGSGSGTPVPDKSAGGDLAVVSGTRVPDLRVAPAPLAAPFDAAAAKSGQAAWAKHLGTQVETTNSVGMKLVLIPPGEFLMGSTDEQVAAALRAAEEIKADQLIKDRIQKAERPQHRVTITKPFLLGETEVTVGQLKKFVDATKYVTEDIAKANGEKGKNWQALGHPVTDELPVTQVTWNDAVAFCNWLSEQQDLEPSYRRDGDTWSVRPTQSGYRLPTEAEWEYACRAGTATQYSFGDDWHELQEYGWFNQNAGGRPRAVGLKLPNAFGLFDMHGNVMEWCQDYYDELWYAKTAPDTTNGPSSGSVRVFRGGAWRYNASECRSAFRSWQFARGRNYDGFGFRVARMLDVSPAETVLATTAAPSASATSPTKPWETPAFQQWVAETQKLPAQQQIEAVSKKLMELNPGFDGKLAGSGKPTPRVEKGSVTEVQFAAHKVTDLSPLRVWMSLRLLRCSADEQHHSDLADLSPLQGMSLTELKCRYSQVSDLAPLQGMPLGILHLTGTKVADLAPLRGMPLADLALNGCSQLKDVSPLAGMPLATLSINNTQVADLSPLQNCSKLTRLDAYKNGVKAAAVASLQKALPNCKIDWDDPAKATAKKLAYLDPAFQQWVKATQALPAEQQIEAVRKKLMELNPGFDGKMKSWGNASAPRVKDGVVTEVDINPDGVSDLSPLRGLAGLSSFSCKGTGRGRSKLSLSDLSPLAGMQLMAFSCAYTEVTDLSPLRGMPLAYLNTDAKVSDLSALEGMPLTTLTISSRNVSDLSPLRGMPLQHLGCYGTRVSDLSPLRGMPLADLNCRDTLVADLSPLVDCQTLTKLVATRTKVTPASVAAIQKALPNCKIDWDDPAKGASSDKQ